jgi:hypothetical protein
MAAYFRRSVIDKWLRFGANVANSCSLCPEQTIFSVLYIDMIFINTSSMKLKEHNHDQTQLMARLLMEQMAGAVKCLPCPLETPVLNLGWGMGYPDAGVTSRRPSRSCV